MSPENLHVLFRGLALAFAIFLGCSLYHNFSKKGTKKKTIVFGAIAFVIFLVLVWVIFFNADYKVENLKKRLSDGDNPYAENRIFKDVAIFIGVALRLVIFIGIAAVYWYLFKKSKKYPPVTGIKIYRILLVCGFIGVPNFIINGLRHYVFNGSGYLHIVGVLDTLYVETLATAGSYTYLETMPFGIYTGLFVGNIFWFFICSILAAAVLPETTDPSKKNH
jgi:hypothetical protein